MDPTRAPHAAVTAGPMAREAARFLRRAPIQVLCALFAAGALGLVLERLVLGPPAPLLEPESLEDVWEWSVAMIRDDALRELLVVPVASLEASFLGFVAARVHRVAPPSFVEYLRPRILPIAGLLALRAILWPFAFFLFVLPSLVLDVGIVLVASRLLLTDEGFAVASREVSHALWRRLVFLTCVVVVPRLLVGAAIGWFVDTEALAARPMGILAAAALDLPTRALMWLPALAATSVLLGRGATIAPRASRAHALEGVSSSRGLALRIAAGIGWVACLLATIVVWALVCRSSGWGVLLLTATPPIAVVVWVWAFGLGRAGVILLVSASTATQVALTEAITIWSMSAWVLVLFALTLEHEYNRLTARPPRDAEGLLLMEEQTAPPTRWKVIARGEVIFFLISALLVVIAIAWFWFYVLGDVLRRGPRRLLFPATAGGFAFAGWLLLRAKQAAVRRADELREEDPRAALVLLRPFRLPRGTFEPMLARLAWPYGPLVTLKLPDQEDEEGAAPLSAAEGVPWQQVVEEEVAAASLVFFCIGPGEGLRWELERVIAGDLTKLVLFRPPDHPSEEFDWPAFLSGAEGTPLEPLLAEDMSDVVLVRFDRDGRAISIRMGFARASVALDEALRRYVFSGDPRTSPLLVAFGLSRAGDRPVVPSGWARA